MNLTRLFATVAAAALMAAPALRANAPVMNQEQARIARQVQKEISMLSNYGVFDNIAFSLDGTKVTLMGEASRPTLKKSAERVVKRIEGVSEVENRLEVLPNSNNDDRIRAAVYARIYGHPALSRYNPNRGTPIWVSPARLAAGITLDPPVGYHPIHIIVRNGDVRLVGAVDTEGDKTVAGIQANSTFGVFSVTNDLTVASKAEQAD